MSWKQYGYIYMMINGKREAEHRHIMEQHIGRPLTEDEVVHHINEIRDDNRIENLEIMTNSEHMRLHNTDKTMGPKARSKISRKNRKITDKQIKEIIEKYIPHKYTAKMLSEEYGINTNTIYDIIHNTIRRTEY